jgi:hypothetical protein
MALNLMERSLLVTHRFTTGNFPVVGSRKHRVEWAKQLVGNAVRSPYTR